MSSFRKLLSRIKSRILTINNGISYYYNDMRYFMRNSKLGEWSESRDSWMASLAALYHVIEKGLSMPNRRLGFGRERLILLIERSNSYYKKFGMDSQLNYAIAIVKEYDELHKKEKFKLDQQLQDKIDNL